MSRFVSLLCIALLVGARSVSAAPEGLSPKELAACRALYVRKCARCHRLYEPGAYSSRAWEEWMTKMRRKARLNAQQHDQLLWYLQSLSAPSP